VSYYVKGMGAALIAECNQERLTFRGGTGLLACQLRDTLKFADAAYDRITQLEAALNTIATLTVSDPLLTLSFMRSIARSALETKAEPVWHSTHVLHDTESWEFCAKCGWTDASEEGKDMLTQECTEANRVGIK
jgi:hypothetical protein